MNIIRLVVAVVIGGTLLAPHTMYAADLTVRCSNTSCGIISGTQPLFDESNIIPGQSFIRNVLVENNRSNACDLHIQTRNVTEDTSGFSDALHIDAIRGGGSVHAGSVALLAGNPGSIGVVQAQESAEYELSLTFDQEAGNSFQDSFVSFDFDMHFTCVSPSPTPQIAGITTDMPSGTGGEEPRVLGISTLADAGLPYLLPAYLLVALSFLGAAYSLDRRHRRK